MTSGTAGRIGFAVLCTGQTRDMDAEDTIDSATVVVTPCADGPLLIRGAFTLVAQDGTVIDPGRATVALCRCGKSAVKPFCDGTHKLVGFRAASRREASGRLRLGHGRRGAVATSARTASDRAGARRSAGPG